MEYSLLLRLRNDKVYNSFYFEIKNNNKYLIKTGVQTMAKQGNRNIIKLKSTESPHCYYSTKNKRNSPDRLELKKYDPVVRRHVVYKEGKM